MCRRHPGGRLVTARPSDTRPPTASLPRGARHLAPSLRGNTQEHDFHLQASACGKLLRRTRQPPCDFYPEAVQSSLSLPYKVPENT